MSVSEQDTLGTEQEQFSEVIAGAGHGVRLVDTSWTGNTGVDASKTGLRATSCRTATQTTCIIIIIIIIYLLNQHQTVMYSNAI